MKEFTAVQAAMLADDVFTVGEKELLKGKTGGPGIIKCRNAFGVTLLGTNQLKGHAVIIFKGTQYLADWLTNLKISVSRSASGQPVHDSFNTSFKSMEIDIANFLSVARAQNVHTIHCVAHSLGGALATIRGDWIGTNYKTWKPYVYSFGSPRVGLLDFANFCTTTLGAERIFWAYYKTDIVPCIPIWTYIHTSSSGCDCYLPAPGIVPMTGYHGMNDYVDSAEGKSWPVLAKLRSDKKSENGIKEWIKNSSPAGITISSIEWPNQAFVYVLKKCVDSAAWVISTSATISLTLMDRRAYILKKGVDISETASSWVIYLKRKILQVLGMKRVVEAADLTYTFVRSVLINLQQKINQFVENFLNKTMVNGRAI